MRYFGVEIDADQVVPYWKGEITLPTQTEHRPDKESVQFPVDEPKEPVFTRMTDAETPDPISVFSIARSPTSQPTPLRPPTVRARTTRRQRRPDADRMR